MHIFKENLHNFLNFPENVIHDLISCVLKTTVTCKSLV